MAEGITIRALFVRLGVLADTDKAKAFDRQLDKVKGSMVALESRAKGFATSVAASLATAFAGVALTSAITETAALGDTAAKAGKAIGLTAEEYQELAFAADRSGTSINVMQKALQAVSKRALQAQRGSAEAARAFSDLGVDVEGSQGNLRSQADILGDLADRFRELPPGSEESARAMEIFGKAGAEMIPLLDEGSAGIGALRREARDLGLVMSNETAASSEKAVDAMTNLKASLLGLRTSIVSQLFPSLIKGGNALAIWISQGGGAEKIVLGLKRAVVALGAALGVLALARAGQGLAALGAQALALAPKIALATATLVKMALASVNLKSILTGPVGLVRGIFSLKTVVVGLQGALLAVPIALGAILLAGQDLSVWLRGGESLIGSFIEKWRDSSGPLGMAARLLESMAPTLASLFDSIKAVAQDALPGMISGVAKVAQQWLAAARQIIAEFGPPILDAVKQVIESVVEIAPRIFRAGRAVVGAAVKIFAALLPPALAFIARLAQTIETIVPIVAGIIAVIADIIAVLAPKISAVLTFGLGLITQVAAFILRILGAITSVVSPIATQILSWWDSLAETATAALDEIKAGIESVMQFLEPLLTGLDSAIDAASSFLGLGGETAATGGGSILDNIRTDIASDMAGRQQAMAQAGTAGTTIEIASVSTTVQPQPGATQVEAARLTRTAVLGSLEQELAAAGRDFG